MHPQYRIIRELQRRIVVGRYPVGQRLPTECLLADEFEVSRGTVRRALQRLTDSGAVERRPGVGCVVRSAAEELEDGHRSVVFLYPESTLLNARTISAMEQSAFRHGADFGLFAIPPEPETVRRTVERLKRLGTTGIVFIPFIRNNYSDVNNRLLDLFEAYELRCVVIDTPVTRADLIRGDFVRQDDYGAMRELVKRLIRRGYRRFASIRVFASVYSASRRLQGLVDELNARQLPVSPELHRVIDDVPLPEQGRKQLREILALPEPPDAVLCSYDIIAMNVLDELKKLGRRVPEDIAVAGFGDTDYYSPLFELTSVRQPMAEIGTRAVEFLLENRPAVRQEFLACEVILRQSTGEER